MKVSGSVSCEVTRTAGEIASDLYRDQHGALHLIFDIRWRIIIILNKLWDQSNFLKAGQPYFYFF